MILLEKKLPKNCDIILHGDTHIGSSMCHYSALDAIVDRTVHEKNTFIIHMGDWIEAISSDDYRFQSDTTKEPIPLKQAKMAIDIYRRASKKFIVGLMGNHEEKLIRFGDLSEVICNGLGIPYGTWTTKLSLDFGSSKMKFFLMHGGRFSIGSGAKDFEQQQANMKASLKIKMSQKASDCILMAMGHTHKLLICPPSERLILADDGKKIIQKYLGLGDGNADYIEPDRRYYLNTGSFLKTYELGTSGYAERAGYDPVELGYCNVRISGGKIEKVDRVVV